VFRPRKAIQTSCPLVPVELCKRCFKRLVHLCPLNCASVCANVGSLTPRPPLRPLIVDNYNKPGSFFSPEASVTSPRSVLFSRFAPRMSRRYWVAGRSLSLEIDDSFVKVGKTTFPLRLYNRSSQVKTAGSTDGLSNLPTDAFDVCLSFLNFAEFHSLQLLARGLRVKIAIDQRIWPHKFNDINLRRRLHHLSAYEEFMEVAHARFLAKQFVSDLRTYGARFEWNPPATTKLVKKTEQSLGFPLPLQYLASLLLHNGQCCWGSALIDGQYMLSCKAMLELYERIQSLGVLPGSNRHILPVCSGVSPDQPFLFLDLSKPDSPVGMSSPMGTTRHILHQNWFSFLASIIP
jgi:hypothetical protein